MSPAKQNEWGKPQDDVAGTSSLNRESWFSSLCASSRENTRSWLRISNKSELPGWVAWVRGDCSRGWGDFISRWILFLLCWSDSGASISFSFSAILSASEQLELINSCLIRSNSLVMELLMGWLKVGCGRKSARVLSLSRGLMVLVVWLFPLGWLLVGLGRRAVVFGRWLIVLGTWLVGLDLMLVSLGRWLLVGWKAASIDWSSYPDASFWSTVCLWGNILMTEQTRAGADVPLDVVWNFVWLSPFSVRISEPVFWLREVEEELDDSCSDLFISFIKCWSSIFPSWLL